MYVLIKILKTLTGSNCRSYQCKYGVNLKLYNADPDRIGLGEAIRKVLTYEKLKGKFSSVNAALELSGVVRVEVVEDGFLFVGKSSGLCLHVSI